MRILRDKTKQKFIEKVGLPGNTKCELVYSSSDEWFIKAYTNKSPQVYAMDKSTKHVVKMDSFIELQTPKLKPYLS